jgi:23S rRNA pseudouridine2604 synthase
LIEITEKIIFLIYNVEKGQIDMKKDNIPQGELIRLNKYLSDSGVCSRREADRLVEEGKVLVDGVKATLGQKVTKDQEIICKGKIVNREDELILLAFNKPRGIITSTSDEQGESVVKYINYHKRIYPVGRLDKDSEGLLLLTNDGSIADAIMRSRNEHEKEYIVSVHKNIDKHFVELMSNGVPILDTVTKKCKVKQIDDRRFRIILTQGLNRQIRRMCEYLGYKVTRLKRVRIMNINLGNLKVGEYRSLTSEEIRVLKSLLCKSRLKRLRLRKLQIGPALSGLPSIIIFRTSMSFWNGSAGKRSSVRPGHCFRIICRERLSPFSLRRS